jgi:hypothetical protein
MNVHVAVGKTIRWNLDLGRKITFHMHSQFDQFHAFFMVIVMQ